MTLQEYSEVPTLNSFLTPPKLADFLPELAELDTDALSSAEKWLNVLLLIPRPEGALVQ